MKATLLFFFVLNGANADAQTVTIQKLHHAGASTPLIDSKDSDNLKSPGYLTLVTQNPLIVAEDPVTSYTNRASVIVNPAKSALMVDFKEDIPKQRITVAISYEDGELLQSQSFLPNGREQTVLLPKLKSTTFYASRYNVAVYQDDKRVLYWGQFFK